MHLYLVRHGRAKSKQVDSAQNLSEEGQREAAKMAGFIKARGLHVGAVWHSGKARAAQTAEVLVSAVKTDGGLVQHDGLAPNDPIEPVRIKIEQHNTDLMIVGHLPFLSKLTCKLLSDDETRGIISFPTGGVVCLEHIAEVDWKLAWMITPQLLP